MAMSSPSSVRLFVRMSLRSHVACEICKVIRYVAAPVTFVHTVTVISVKQNISGSWSGMCNVTLRLGW